MYKAGKYWLFASIAVASFGLLTAVDGASVHADSTPTSQAPINNTTSQTVNQSSSASQSVSASQSTSQSISASQSTSVSQSTSQSTSVSQSESQSANESSTGSDSADSQTLEMRLGGADSAANSEQLGANLSTGNTSTVTPNADSGRTDFNNTVNSGQTVQTPTSVTVAVPDQITNPQNYQQKKVDVATFDQLNAAWQDGSTTYINITQDITPGATGSLGWRPASSSVVINGNGHTIDLGQNNFRMYDSYSANNITLTNANFQQGYNWGDNDNQDESLVRIGVGEYTSMVVDNVSLSNDAANTNAIRLAYLGYGGKITFSGTNTFNITNELTRAVTSINFANGASVKVQRTANDYKNSIFYMGVIAYPGYAGYGNNITMGDGSSFSASLYDVSQSANYSTIYQYLNGMTVGDNVTWSQNGFQRFIYMPDNGGVQNAVFTFGQNFDLIIPKTTQAYSIYLVNNTKMIFNAGAQVDINQYYPDVVVALGGTSSIQFISPKKLHLAMLNTNGTPANNGYGVIYNFGLASTAFTINNSNLSSWTGYDTATATPNGDINGQFSQLIIKNAANAYLVNSDGSTTPTNIISNQSREIQTNSIAPGNIYVQYVDQNGNNVGDKKLISMPSDAYIGQFLSLKTKEVSQVDMPANYMWALGNQVYAGAKTDAQSGGDSSTTSDNGDSDTGQANVAIVPVLGTNFVYKVYVYGQPETTSYEYVDQNTGKIMSAQNAGTTAPVSSNYGNIIDWTDSYYTKNGVPDGYHLSTTATQPTTTTVGTSNPTVQLYVEGNSQTVTPTYQTDGGQTLSPASPITMTGITGQTVTIPIEPAVDNYEISYVLVNGQKVAPGASLTLANGTDTVVYVYKSLDGSRNAAEVAINGAADTAIQKINDLPNMSDTDKAAAVNKVKAEQATAITTIQTAKSKDVVEDAQNSGVLSIQRDAAAAVIDSDANTQASQVAGMNNISSADQKTALQQIETHRNNAQADLSNATSAADLQTKINAANVTLTQDGSEAELNDYGQSALKQISQMPGLSADQLAQAAQDINRAVTNGQNNIGTKSLIDDVLAALKAGENDVDNLKNGYQGQSETAMNTAKSNTISALGQFATDAKAKIAALAPLSADAKQAADQVIDQQVAAATTNINNSANTEQVAEAQINGQVAVSQTVANSTLDNDALIATNKVNALSNIDTTAKQAAITKVTNAQAAAKQSVQSATNTNDITTVQSAGQTKEAQIASEAVLDDAALQQTNIISALKNLGANQQQAIDQVNADRDNAKTKVNTTTTPSLAQSEEQNGVLVITRDGDQTVLTDYAVAAQNRIAALPDLNEAQISQATTGIKNALQTGQDNITSAQQVTDATAALQKAEEVIDSITATAQTNSDTTVKNAKSTAGDAIDQAVAAAKTVVQQLNPLSDQANRLSQIQKDGDAAKAKIAADQNTAAISSDQTTGLQAITNDKNAAVLQSAKEGAIAAVTQVNQDTKTAIGHLTPLDSKEIQAYQDQADVVLATATSQINQETTVNAVNGDQTDFSSQISSIQDAANLQNSKEADNHQLDQYGQNAKNAIADKTIMPDLTPEQISDYDGQIDAAITAGQSSINGGQDTTTVTTNFQAAKDSIDKIKAAAQAQSATIVAKAKSDADGAIDQAVENAQAAVQQLSPLQDQADRLAAIKSDGDAAKVKIAADQNSADIANDQAAGLQKISADQAAATLASAKEAAIAAVTQAGATAKTIIGGLQPLQSDETQTFQNQVDAAVTAATNLINQETTTAAVTNDQTNAISNTITGIQTAASLQNMKEADNAQLLKDGQTAKNKILALPNLTEDQINQANRDIDSTVSNGQAAINGSQNQADVLTNFQTAESSLNKVITTTQSQSDNALVNAKTAAGTALDQAAAAAKTAIDQLPVLDTNEKTTFKDNVDAAVTAAKNSIQNETTIAAVTVDQNNGLTTISNQQATAALQNAKEDSINQLNAYAQNGRTALTKLPNLTDAQASQANTSITNAVTSGTTNINAATDLAGVTRSLVAAEFAINRAGVIAINQSNAALISARTAADATIDAVATAVKATINNLTLLSDRQTRLDQVDTDVTSAKTALESTSATADVTAAQGKAMAALNADAANAQQKSSQEDAISRLQNYATNAETAVALMPGLSADNVTTAKTAIENAVNNGNNNILGASEHAAMASALIAAEQAIDAAATTAQNQSQQALNQAQSDATAAIDATLAAAQEKLNHLSLSTDDQAAQEKQLEADAGNAKTSINVATSLSSINQAQQTGVQAINQDVLSAEIVSLQTEAKKRLQAYADQTKSTISSLPDLPSDSYTSADNGIDDLVKVWSGNIVNTRNLADMQSALYSGESAINIVSLTAQANSQKIVDQERSAAEAAINQAAATASQTINGLNPLSDMTARLNQIDQDVKDAEAALDAAKNNQGFLAAQSAGTTAITNHVTAAQLKSAQEKADADLTTYGQNAYAKIMALPDLTDAQRQQANTDITNAVNQGQSAIDATTSQADVAPALAAAEKVIDGIQATAQNNNQAAVQQAQSDADAVIEAAVKAAKATLDGLTPLSDQQSRENQIDTDAQNAKNAVAKATTMADVTTAQNAGTTAITNDTTAAQLQSAKEKANADLANYGQSAKNAIKAMPDLTDVQRQQADDAVDAAVSSGQTNINASTDTNGVAKALTDGKAAVDQAQDTAQEQSNAAVQQERDAADAAIDAAVKQAKDTINGLNPLSDEAMRLAQVDTAADNAKKAILQATNETDIKTAQNVGTSAITQAATDAQLKSKKEAADAALATYGQIAKDAIAKMPDLTQDQIDQANQDIAAAVQAGQGQIDASADAAGVATALANGEQAVDAVQASSQTNSDTTVQQEQKNADAAIDAAVKNANATIEGMNPLADKMTPEKAVAAAAQVAKEAIAKAGNKNDITSAQNSGTTAIANQTTAAQLQSTKEAAIATLTQADQDAKNQIKALPDLTTDQIAAANAAIDAAFNAGQEQIQAATDANGVATALTSGQAGIKDAEDVAQAESAATVAKEKSDAKATIDAAAKQATDQIDAMTPLSDKQNREAQVATDAQNAKDEIDQAKNKVSIMAAQTTGTAVITNDTVAAQLQSTKETDKNTLAADGQEAKDKIKVMPDLTTDQINTFNDQIDAAVQAAQGQIDASADAAGVATAFAAGEKNLENIQQDAQNISDATVANERMMADNAIDAAVKAAKATLEGMNPLADKATPESQIDAAAQAAKTAIADAQNQTGINAAQDSGQDAINKVTAAGQLQSAKEAANAALTQYGQSAKDKIALMPDLTTDQISQANAQIDAAVNTGQGNIAGATDANGVAAALKNGKAAVDAVQTNAQINSNTTVSNEKAAANSVIDAAAVKAKEAIAALSPLSDKAAREAQIDQDAAAAKKAINNATNETDIAKAQKAGTDTLDTDTGNAQLKSAQEQANAELTQYGQSAKGKIASMPDLTTDQINQANAQIDSVVQAGQTNIAGATDVNGVAAVLKNGEAAVDAVQAKSQSSSDAIVKTAKDAANSAIDAAAAKAKATIDGLNPLSDKADRENQVDQDAAAAKLKIAQDTTTEQVAADQSSGLSAINNDVSAAQVESAQEDATARLRAYADNAEAAITSLPDLPAADLTDAKAKIEAAVAAGDKALTAAQTIDDVKSALTNAEQTIDGVSTTAQGQSNQVVSDAKQDAKNAITAAAAKAKASIEDLTPLSESEKQAKENQVDQDAQIAAQSIDAATDTAAITQAKQTGINNINQDVLYSQVENAQRDAAARLLAYANQAKQTITSLPDLTTDQINQANADIDEKVQTWTDNINQAQNLASVQTALADGEKAIDNISLASQSQSQQTVTKEKNAADSVIDAVAAKAKAAIDGLTPLSDKAARETQIDQDAAAAKAAIVQATNAAEITKAQNAGTDRLNVDTAAAQLQSQKEAAAAALTQYGQAAKDKIAALPDLTPDQINQADAEIAAAVKAGLGQIAAATDTNGVTTALNNSQAAVDQVAAAAANISGQTVASARTQAKTAIDNASGQAKATIDGLTALVAAQKGADKAKVDQDAAAAKAQIDQATTTQAIQQELDDGLATIQKDVANSIFVNTKADADNQLAGYGQAAKDKIDKLPNLTPDEIAQADREIDEIITQGKQAIALAAAENEVKVAFQTNEEEIDGVVANVQAESDRQKPVVKTAETLPAPQSAPNQAPALPMTGRLQKHEANMALLPLVALGLLTFLSGKRRRQRDDEK